MHKVKETSFMYFFLIGLGQLIIMGCIKFLFFPFFLINLGKPHGYKRSTEINYHKL